jgi:hypothetical protein
MDEAKALASIDRAEALQMEILELFDKRSHLNVFELVMACLGAAGCVIKNLRCVDPEMAASLCGEMKDWAPRWADGEPFEEHPSGTH